MANAVLLLHNILESVATLKVGIMYHARLEVRAQSKMPLMSLFVTVVAGWPDPGPRMW